MPGPQPRAWSDLMELALSSSNDECLLTHSRHGYRTVRHQGKSHAAHHWVCRAVHGPPPDGKPHALHSCDDKRCVNPRHLRWGDAADNAADYLSTDRAWQELRRSRKLSDDDIVAIRTAPRTYRVCIELAQQYEIARDTVAKIRAGCYHR